MKIAAPIIVALTACFLLWFAFAPPDLFLHGADVLAVVFVILWFPPTRWLLISGVMLGVAVCWALVTSIGMMFKAFRKRKLV